jgi:hypothetical protein
VLTRCIGRRRSRLPSICFFLRVSMSSLARLTDCATDRSTPGRQSAVAVSAHAQEAQQSRMDKSKIDRTRSILVGRSVVAAARGRELRMLAARSQTARGQDAFR